MEKQTQIWIIKQKLTQKKKIPITGTDASPVVVGGEGSPKASPDGAS